MREGCVLGVSHAPSQEGGTPARPEFWRSLTVWPRTTKFDMVSRERVACIFLWDSHAPIATDWASALLNYWGSSPLTPSLFDVEWQIWHGWHMRGRFRSMPRNCIFVKCIRFVSDSRVSGQVTVRSPDRQTNVSNPRYYPRNCFYYRGISVCWNIPASTRYCDCCLSPQPLTLPITAPVKKTLSAVSDEYEHCGYY